MHFVSACCQLVSASSNPSTQAGVIMSGLGSIMSWLDSVTLAAGFIQFRAGIDLFGARPSLGVVSIQVWVSRSNLDQLQGDVNRYKRWARAIYRPTSGSDRPSLWAALPTNLWQDTPSTRSEFRQTRATRVIDKRCRCWSQIWPKLSDMWSNPIPKWSSCAKAPHALAEPSQTCLAQRPKLAERPPRPKLSETCGRSASSRHTRPERARRASHASSPSWRPTCRHGHPPTIAATGCSPAKGGRRAPTPLSMAPRG